MVLGISELNVQDRCMVQMDLLYSYFLSLYPNHIRIPARSPVSGAGSRPKLEALLEAGANLYALDYLK